MSKYGLNNITDILFKNNKVSNESNTPDSHVGTEDENTERGNWSSKREYMLSMIGYAVGLGNVWRFPYLAYKHGGGAFLIPYTIMLAVAGLPLFFMESSFGQFCSQGPINVWKAVPILQGVGITMMLVSTLLAIYYNVIIAYSIYYLFASFQYPLPWSGSSNCNTTEIALNVTAENQTCLDFLPGQSPSEKYWDMVALQRTSSMDETGPVVWHLALSLLLAWILVAAALFKGIKSSGKVVYFTATFPYIVLLILLIRGVTLEGAKDGIEYYIGAQSNLTKLVEAEVWKDAATQIFFSLSIAWGGLMALSSYNKFNNNCYQDSIIVCVINCSTSVFAGFAIFSILGHMAHVYRIPVSDIAKEGFGLAFIAYPDALSKLPISPLWSILFFIMLITLGLDSQFAIIEVIATCLQDAYPHVLKSKRGLITIAICTALFLLGLPCVTGAGIYWVNLMDTFCAGWIILVAGLIEVLGLSILYGGNRFIKDIEMMIKTRSSLFWLWWKACWFFITPVVLAFILGWSLYTLKPPTYGTVPYPEWGNALGWCMTSFCLIWIPFVAVWKVYKSNGSIWQRIRTACSPTEDWGPYLECHKGQRYLARGVPDANVFVISNKYTTRL
ncbi:sodium- and chloride-dependent neutral and basic amino acid transporter B(0+)-like [Xyrauchen texanus]|uniref:sodium- and chloride-dependent neutral and basic amino acid transporter B(0+)-like n=1 Tax=Xyrauchen texanus TaxID=154827 RepID=UPI00224217F0|nr:sodium- and chloride-dependent neutral and basic amino acid transporter B(0+)-like [Xyrauchen texanus]